MTRTLCVLLALGAAALAGCGSGGSSTSTSAPAASTAAAPAVPSTGKAVSVTMKNIQFSPKSVTVKVGDSIKWTNEDSVAHNVVADGGAFKSDDFGKGSVFIYKATKPGTIKYVCTIHPGMDGTLTVTK